MNDIGTIVQQSYRKINVDY